MKILCYNFKNKDLLVNALTHPSVSSSSSDIKFHYERLELLGDAVLGFIMKDILFNKHPDYKEGQLSQKFALLTSREYCYKIGTKLTINKFMNMSKGEEKNGGRALKANISNAVEAILGAIYLDSNDTKICKQIITYHWSEFLDVENYLEPKTALQEWSQEKLKSLPQYNLISIDGPEHNPKFLIQLQLSNGLKANGEGNSRKKAEQNAAQHMITIIEEQNKKA